MNTCRAVNLALVGRYLVVLGLACLVMVVLTHVCERLHLLPWMGWGLQHSPGHYLDLCAAVLGLISLAAGYLVWTFSDKHVSEGQYDRQADEAGP